MRHLRETLICLENLSASEHADAEGRAIEVLSDLLHTPRPGHMAMRADEPEYTELIKLTAKLKASVASMASPSSAV